MYLALKCNWINNYDSIVLAAELVPSRPSFVTEESDYVFCNLSTTMPTDNEIQNFMVRVVKSIGSVHVKNVPSTATEIVIGKIAFQGNEDRRIYPNQWNDTVRPAWVRAAATVNQFNL